MLLTTNEEQGHFVVSESFSFCLLFINSHVISHILMFSYSSFMCLECVTLCFKFFFLMFCDSRNKDNNLAEMFSLHGLLQTDLNISIVFITKLKTSFSLLYFSAA